MPEVRLNYVGNPKGLVVRLIHTWHRGDTELAGCPHMSASSGPKDYEINQIWDYLDKHRDVDAMSMVRASGPPFYIMRKGKKYFDVSGQEVEVVPKKGAHPATTPGVVGGES